MATTLTMPYDLEMIGVQSPLFLEHQHLVMVMSIRLVDPKRVRIKWKGVEGSALENHEFSETFNLSRRIGKEKLKDFLFAMSLEPQDGAVDLDGCLGEAIEVMAIQRPAGRSSRWEILHHFL